MVVLACHQVVSDGQRELVVSNRQTVETVASIRLMAAVISDLRKEVADLAHPEAVVDLAHPEGVADLASQVVETADLASQVVETADLASQVVETADLVHQLAVSAKDFPKLMICY